MCTDCCQTEEKAIQNLWRKCLRVNRMGGLRRNLLFSVKHPIPKANGESVTACCAADLRLQVIRDSLLFRPLQGRAWTQT